MSAPGQTRATLLGLAVGAALAAAVTSVVGFRVVEREQHRTQAVQSALSHQQQLAAEQTERLLALTTKTEQLEQELKKAIELERTASARAENAEDELSKALLRCMIGKVTSIAGTLAVVTLGSKNGLELGQTLQVYRTSPEPQYLGR